MIRKQSTAAWRGAASSPGATTRTTAGATNAPSTPTTLTSTATVTVVLRTNRFGERAASGVNAGTKIWFATTRKICARPSGTSEPAKYASEALDARYRMAIAAMNANPETIPNAALSTDDPAARTSGVAPVFAGAPPSGGASAEAIGRHTVRRGGRSRVLRPAEGLQLTGLS